MAVRPVEDTMDTARKKPAAPPPRAAQSPGASPQGDHPSDIGRLIYEAHKKAMRAAMARAALRSWDELPASIRASWECVERRSWHEAERLAYLTKLNPARAVQTGGAK
ncbi:hypothetical protein AZ34_10315 [Hylemonella gracilis str. Niagara R]|uniref:Uncharacterized protein n=1 Tax=Hylemonella gracilis str. Niagara R TaxID=1458275 RepID=A0A016XNS0_9BURK|nr:hypothetical protein AZ34_10315 [Hylemonella gracilis str. Niagara R]